MSDLVVTVRQISNYPTIGVANGAENVLVQQGGPGAPYASIPTANLVATALNDQGAMGIGYPLPVPPPSPGQLFAGNFIAPNQGGFQFNLYLDDQPTLRYWSSGPAADWSWGAEGGFVWRQFSAGGAGQPATFPAPLMQLGIAGALQLNFGTLSVARDPAASNEVATSGWVSRNTVASFNNRNGQVQLNSNDVYSALMLCDPIATQPWVQSAINASIQNLLYTCPFVNTWNGRKGSVSLMLSDITCVFFQSGQQPIAPTPPPGSNDYSIATTQWVTGFAGFTGVITPQDFGAKGDGVTDDTSAVQAAFTAVVAGGEVWFPKGTYVLAGVITLSPTAAISIRGAGSDVTVLNCASNGIALTLGSNGHAIIRDLSIVYTGTGVANTGLALSSPDQSAFVVLEDLKIRGNQSRTTGWLTGISMTGIGTPMLDKIVFQGPDGNGTAGATGIFYGGNVGTSQYATGFRLTNSLIQGGQYGVRIGSYVQGVYVLGTDIIGNDYGVYWNVTGGGVNVWLAITNCHLNCGSRNIYTNGVIEIGISNTLSYRFANGITNWAAIELVAAWKVVVSGNTMNAVGADTETGIILTGGGTDSNIISGNAFEHINGPAIILSGSTARATITGNNAQNITGPDAAFINDTTGNATNMAVGNTYLGQSDLNSRGSNLFVSGNIEPLAAGQYLGAGGVNQSWATLFANSIAVGPDGGPFSTMAGNALGEVVIAGVPRPDSTTRNLGSSGFPWQSGYFGSLFVNNTTIRSGAGAATGTQPHGSLWLRTDGAAGSTLYVSQGGGTWAAVAGV